MTGVQRYAMEVARRLKKHYGDKILVVAPNNIELKEEARELGAQVIGTHTGYYWEQVELPKFLKEHESPLLLCLTNIAPLFYKNKMTVVHDVAFCVYPQTFSKKVLMLYKFMFPIILKTSKTVFTVSEYSKQEILKYYRIDAEKVKVAYPGYNTFFHHVSPKEKNTEKYVLAVSSLNYRKNFIRILQAFEQATKEHTGEPLKLYIVGDITSPAFKSINISAYTKNPAFRFLGRVSDERLRELYSQAVCFLYPSLYEGFGLPILEAQACRCPLITANVTSMPEVARDSALLCDPTSVEEIKQAILQLTSQPELREEYIKKGEENVQNFSYDFTTQSIIETISSSL